MRLNEYIKNKKYFHYTTINALLGILTDKKIRGSGVIPYISFSTEENFSMLRRTLIRKPNVQIIVNLNLYKKEIFDYYKDGNEDESEIRVKEDYIPIKNIIEINIYKNYIEQKTLIDDVIMLSNKNNIKINVI